MKSPRRFGGPLNRKGIRGVCLREEGSKPRRSLDPKEVAIEAYETITGLPFRFQRDEPKRYLTPRSSYE